LYSSDNRLISYHKLKASKNSAFDSAAVYFKAGYKLLGPSGWGIDQQTMLTLCSQGANACFLSGDLDTMNKLLAEVLSQDISIQDKFVAYEVNCLAIYAAGDFMGAIDTAIDVRRQLGLSTFKNKPVNTLIIIKEFIKTKRTVGSRTAEEIANLPDLTDERVVMGQRMLELLFTSSIDVSKNLKLEDLCLVK